jgi:hypothetical protein
LSRDKAIGCLVGECYVHDFDETGNVKYFVNFLGNICNGKTILAHRLEVYETDSQKSGGNIIDIGKVKNKPNVFAALREMGYALQQFVFDLRASESVKLTRK